MASRIAKTLGALLLGLSGWAAANTPIDIFKTVGVPGTGGTATVAGPCYCDQTAVYSPVFLLAPGTYDFGQVRDFWVQSGSTPDGGPDQPNLYLLFVPVEVAGIYPDDFGAPPAYDFPSTALCAQTDDACNATYRGAYLDTSLVFTVAAGQDAVQVALFGPYAYTSPLPEPLSYAMLLAGLILLAGARRGDRT